MIRIGSKEIEMSCPRCRFYNYPTLNLIIERDAIICRGAVPIWDGPVVTNGVYPVGGLRICFSVSIPNQPSTIFSHEPLVGVK